MEFLTEYGLFLLKSLTLVASLLLVLAGIFSLSKKPKSQLKIESLNEEYQALKQQLHAEIKDEKIKKKKKDKADLAKPFLYCFDFDGDIKASQVEELREMITAILAIATPKDEVVLRLESPGGAVNGYGLAAAQLQRLRDKNIPLTVCIDKMAASGGYLMAAVANKIIAAPFAIIGSIGVVAQIPNFHRFLKKHNIDIELLTAGQYKRTLTLLGENTDKGRQKFQDDLEKIHQAFRNAVLTHREALDIEQVSTGEHWLAKEALALKLIDSLQTSDSYLLDKLADFKVFKLTIQRKKALLDKLLQPVARLLSPWA